MQPPMVTRHKNAEAQRRSGVMRSVSVVLFTWNTSQGGLRVKRLWLCLPVIEQREDITQSAMGTLKGGQWAAGRL